MTNITRWITSTGSSTFSGNEEMIDFLCGDQEMDSHYIIFLLINGNVQRVNDLLKDQCSTLPGTHKFFCFGSNYAVLPHQDKGEPIEAFTISSYERTRD